MLSSPVFSMLLGILSSTISACFSDSACCSVFCPPQFQHDVLPSFQHVARYFVLHNFSMSVRYFVPTISVFSMLQCSACCSVFCPPQFQHDVQPSFQHVARYFVLHNQHAVQPSFQHVALSSMMSCLFSMLLGILSSTVSACCPAQFSACCSVFCPQQFQHAVQPSVLQLSSPVFSMLLGILSSTISA